MTGKKKSGATMLIRIMKNSEIKVLPKKILEFQVSNEWSRAKHGKREACRRHCSHKRKRSLSMQEETAWDGGLKECYL